MEENKEKKTEIKEENIKEENKQIYLFLTICFLIISLYFIYTTFSQDSPKYKIGEVYIKNKPDFKFKNFDKVYIFLILEKKGDPINKYLEENTISNLFSRGINFKNGSTIYLIGNKECSFVDLVTAEINNTTKEKCYELINKVNPKIIIEINKENKNNIIYFNNYTMYVLPRNDPTSVERTLKVAKDIMLDRFKF